MELPCWVEPVGSGRGVLEADDDTDALFHFDVVTEEDGRITTPDAVRQYSAVIIRTSPSR